MIFRVQALEIWQMAIEIANDLDEMNLKVSCACHLWCLLMFPVRPTSQFNFYGSAEIVI